MGYIKRIVMVGVVAMLLVVLSILLANYQVNTTTDDRLYDAVKDIPYNKVGIVLGTSKYLQNGQVNLYYSFRIEATIALYKAGKISFVLVSGDNGSKLYDEPTTFKEDLTLVSSQV